MQFGKSIVTKIFVLAATSFIAALVMGTLYYYVTQDGRIARAEKEVSDSILDGAFDLSILTNEFLLTRDGVTLITWQERHEEISQLLSYVDDDFANNTVNFEEIKRDNEVLRKTFSDLVTNERRMMSASDDSEKSTLLETDSELVSKLSTTSRGMVDDARVQQTKLDETLKSVRFTQNVLFAISLLIISIISLFSTIYIYWSVGRRLNKFSLAVSTFSRNKLEFDMDESLLKGGDEISTLAKAFRSMASELRDLYSDLEEKVRTRTKDLKESEGKLTTKLNEVEKLNRLMIGRELKMADLKKELDKLQNSPK